jgi:hypothetical protein
VCRIDQIQQHTNTLNLNKQLNKSIVDIKTAYNTILFGNIAWSRVFQQQKLTDHCNEEYLR